MIKSEAQVKKVKPTGKEQWEMVHNICTGLYLRTTAKGTKSYYYRYGINKKQRKCFLGVSPAMPLREAQRQHVELYNKVKSGVDVVLERQKAKAEAAAHVEGLTFAQLYQKWFEAHGQKLSAGTQANNETKYRVWIAPVIGHIKANMVQPQHIITIRDNALQQGKTAMAKAVIGLVSQIYKYGCSELLVDSWNPAQYIKSSHTVKAGTPWNDEQLKTILTTLDAPNPYHMGYTTRQAIKVLLYSGQRRSQIISTERDWLKFSDDGKTCAVEYPARVMKMGKPFVVYFPEVVTNIIKDTIKYSFESKYLFPSTFKGYGHVSPSHVSGSLKALLQGEGIPEHYTVLDIPFCLVPSG